ncbi:Rqc2 family fibronectin-binding protein [Tissierellaceae bacterium HCP3S3_D8]
MSFDGIVTRSVVRELRENILGGRVDKIYQPEKDEILINIHNKGENHRLLISASSNNPRIYLTKYSKKNPTTPPMFCMLLRKYLSGGIILNIEQYDMDRIVLIDISSLDELGQSSEIRLIVEVMGKHSNIILVDKKTHKILDSITRVTGEMSRVRQVLPGSIYDYPPAQDKANPLYYTREEFFQFIEASKENLVLFKFFYFNYTGMSPLISREICFNANLDIDRPIGSLDHIELEAIYDSFSNTIEDVKSESFNPVYITNELDEIIAFYALDLRQYGNKNQHFSPSISHILDTSYRRRDVFDRISQRSQSMRKSIQVKLDRAINKLAKQKEELIESQDREKLKVYADLISANIHRIPRGIDSIDLENFYDENMSIINVPLDIKLSPVENAQRYYKRYSKLKNAESLLLKQVPETEEEISYLEHVIVGIENAMEIEELNEVRDELIKEGYIKDSSKNRRKKNKEDKLSSPHHYISKDDFHIYVGKNNRQNERLTLKFAHREDLWLHVQNMPGSHVIIKKDNREIPSSTLEEAAMLAAYYSKGKNGNNIAIDYTERKNVKKMKNSKPGMVIYDDFKTIIISPSKEKVNEIKKVED